MTTVMTRPEVKPITPAEETKLKMRLSKAKTSLVLEHPFIGKVALEMPFILDRKVPTAATNGKRVIFNPDFIGELTDEELKFLVAHECMHPMLEHNYRRNERDARKWNQAADYVINKLLVDDNVGKMPKVGLLSDDIYKAGNGTSDGIYNILPDSDDNGGGGVGDPLDDCEDAEGTPAEVAQEAAEWKVKVAQAAQVAKMMGKLSAGMARLVDEVLNPKVDWRDVLHRFLVRAKTDTRTWARPNRRFAGFGMYLPSVSGVQMGDLVFAIDCSGSIDDKTVAQFAAEVRNVQEDLAPRCIHVIYFDSEVSHYEFYKKSDDLDIKPHGGGGTDFAPVFDYMEAHDIDPVAVVFLTDLCCSSYGNEPDCPVLWVSTEQKYDTPPFGEVVVM
jgi:predicted metal-dependent peptidase